MRGKEKCEKLKAIRRQIAEHYGLTYNPTECTHEGDCRGTCPKCDAELQDLQRQLEEKGIRDIDLRTDIRTEIISEEQREDESRDDGKLILEGMDTIQEPLYPGVPAYPDDEPLEGDPLPPEPTERKKKKSFFKECAVAGWNFHHPEDFRDELYEGAELALVRERNNKHDKNAVAVALADDYDGDSEDFDFDCIIGYVPRTDNELIAQMMDMGWSDAFTAVLTTINDHGSYDNRLRMTIYIQSKDEYEEQPHTFAANLDDDAYKDLQSELFEKGFAYFRWGGFPVWERTLPKEGEKVVFIHRNEEDADIYLMHVMATDEDKVGFFIKDEDELHRIDDCTPFILTNIMGPVKVAITDLEFLDGETIEDYHIEKPLTEEASERIMNLITDKNN